MLAFIISLERRADLANTKTMHVYFSGIGGVGIGPLARVARDLGYDVSGSDLHQSRLTDQIAQEGVEVSIGQKEEQIAKVHSQKPIDRIVHTAALPKDHPELKFARENNIAHSKLGEFIAEIVAEHNLKLIAVSGTHGKTSTTAMLAWLFIRLNIPISYIIGTNVPFGPSGHYDNKSEYLVYEADEYDKNMLKFHPYASIIVTADYDHPDTYPTIDDYKQSFKQFADQSKHTVTWKSVADYLDLENQDHRKFLPDDTNFNIKLNGENYRRNASLAIALVEMILEEDGAIHDDLVTAINDFPGTERRFEKLRENIYTDYAHHPEEIRATIDAALEQNKNVVAVYQPHQNVRQHEFKDKYGDCFSKAKGVYWLPTYLSREKDLPILGPNDLIPNLSDPSLAEPKELTKQFAMDLQKLSDEGNLVLFMAAGDLDNWAREHFQEK